MNIPLTNHIQLFIRDILQCPRCGCDDTFVVSSTKIDQNGITQDFTKLYCPCEGISAEINFNEAIKNIFVNNEFNTVSIVVNLEEINTFNKFEFQLISALLSEGASVPTFKQDIVKSLIEEFLCLKANDDTKENYINLLDINAIYKDNSDVNKVYVVINDSKLLTQKQNLNYL